MESKENDLGAPQHDRHGLDNSGDSKPSPHLEEIDALIETSASSGNSSTVYGPEPEERSEQLMQLLRASLVQSLQFTKTGASSSEQAHSLNSYQAGPADLIVSEVFLAFSKEINEVKEDDVMAHDRVKDLLELCDDLPVDQRFLQNTSAVSLVESALNYPVMSLRTKASELLKKWGLRASGQPASGKAAADSNDEKTAGNPTPSSFLASKGITLRNSVLSTSGKTIDIKIIGKKSAQANPLDGGAMHTILRNATGTNGTPESSPSESAMLFALCILRDIIKSDEGMFEGPDAMSILEYLDQLPVTKEIVEGSHILAALEGVQKHRMTGVQAKVDQLITKWRPLMNRQTPGNASPGHPSSNSGYSLYASQLPSDIEAKSRSTSGANQVRDNLKPRAFASATHIAVQGSQIAEPSASAATKGKQASIAKGFTANRSPAVQKSSKVPLRDYASVDQHHMSLGPRQLPLELVDFVNLIQDTYPIDENTVQNFGGDLECLHASLLTLVFGLHRKAEITLAKKNYMLSTQSEIDRLEEEIETPSTNTEDSTGDNQKKRQLLSDLRCRFAQLEDELRENEIVIEDYSTQLTLAAICPLKILWEKVSPKIQEAEGLRQRLVSREVRIKDLLSTEITTRERLARLEQQAADSQSLVAQAEVEKKEKLAELEIKKLEMLKGYYDDVQKLVESRVSDEKTKLAGRLSKAEVALKQRDKAITENEDLQSKVSELVRDKERLILARTAMEGKYRNTKVAADAIQEGYDQLTKDNAELQMEASDLRGDVDRLTEQRDMLLTEKARLQSALDVAQMAMARPQPSLAAKSTSTSRHEQKLGHLHSMVTFWKNTLNTTTSDLAKTHVKKEGLDTKIQDAKLRLQALQRFKDPPAKLTGASAPTIPPVTEFKGPATVSTPLSWKGSPSTSEAWPVLGQSGTSAARISRGEVGPFPPLVSSSALAPRSFAAAAAGKVLRVVDRKKTGSPATKAPTSDTPRPEMNQQDKWQAVDRKGRQKGTTRKN